MESEDVAGSGSERVVMMQEPRVLLYYHIDPKGNFGDDLNPWLWTKLLPGSCHGVVAHDPRTREPLDSSSVLLLGIGTLINDVVPRRNLKIVVGSGVGYGAVPEIDDTWRIRAVRGPLTASRLGIGAHLAVTDPAMLVPCAYSAFSEGAGQRPQIVSYMPHCSSARSADWRALAEDAGMVFIDPQWTVDRVLEAIRNSRVLVTEALHGAILAEAFRIPWIAVRSSPAVLDFKWNDWCASLNITYDPVVVPPLWEGRPGWGAALRTSIKRRMVVSRLRRLANCNGRLADDATVEGKVQRLQEIVADLRKELGSLSVAG